MSGPLISVVIPTYGRAAFLNEAIQSVIRQTYSNVEIIVVDDCSPEPAAVPSGVELFRHLRNMGPGAARNTGLAHATGDLILFLDDDDMLTPYRLQLAVEGIGNARAHAAEMERFFSDGSSARAGIRYEGDMTGYFNQLPNPAIGQVVHLHEDVLQFDPTLRVSQDTEWWIRMADRMVVAWSDEVGLLSRRHLGERLGVDKHSRFHTSREIARRHANKLDPVALARLRGRVAGAALVAGYRRQAVWWSVKSLIAHPTPRGFKRLARSLLPRP